MKFLFIVKIIGALLIAMIVIAFTLYPKVVEHGIDYFMTNYAGEYIDQDHRDEYERDENKFAYDDFDNDYDMDLSR